MLPQSHVAYTWLTLSLAQEHLDIAPDADYRLVAIAAMGSDVVDKPLAWAHFYEKYKSAVLFAHTLIILRICRHPDHRQAAAVLDLRAAFVGHAILDRIWLFPIHLLLALARLAFSCLGQAGSEQEKIGRLLVCFYPAA
jgi:hypothetical protein